MVAQESPRRIIGAMRFAVLKGHWFAVSGLRRSSVAARRYPGITARSWKADNAGSARTRPASASGFRKAQSIEVVASGSRCRFVNPIGRFQAILRLANLFVYGAEHRYQQLVTELAEMIVVVIDRS